MKTEDFLKKHDACFDGEHWAMSVSDDMADVWDALIEQGKHEWLRWTATREGVFSDAVLRKLACRFVRETPLADGRVVWDLLTDERSRKAVEVAESYADGNATDEELYNVRSAAYAARSAANTASCSAGAASYSAAHAAYDAAIAAARSASYSAAHAAYFGARDAAEAAYFGASDAAYAAQVQMITELGNPFRKKEPPTVKQWSNHYVARVLVKETGT